MACSNSSSRSRSHEREADGQRLVARLLGRAGFRSGSKKWSDGDRTSWPPGAAAARSCAPTWTRSVRSGIRDRSRFAGPAAVSWDTERWTRKANSPRPSLPPRPLPEPSRSPSWWTKRSRERVRSGSGCRRQLGRGCSSSSPRSSPSATSRLVTWTSSFGPGGPAVTWPAREIPGSSTGWWRRPNGSARSWSFDRAAPVWESPGTGTRTSRREGRVAPRRASLAPHASGGASGRLARPGPLSHRGAPIGPDQGADR